ncbi:MAG: rod shape-determining protein [Anaerotruncus sp.]|nr:rod shape-determining protein [Anaerotruncus sp.]
MDIGIDLGTATVLVYSGEDGIILREPSVVAVNTKTGEILDVGESAHAMLGKTPAHITAIRPLADGVISNYKMTEVMIKHFLKKACPNSGMRPRVALCVPSLITTVEAQAAGDAALAADARSVYLIEEPVAAAVGAGLDITRSNGNLILDIGGGTSDIAVLSLGGIVCKNSIKMAGNKFNEALMKYIRGKYNLLIGERMAERMKMEIASVDENAEARTFEVKGRNLATGLPGKRLVTRAELYESMLDCAVEIRRAVHSVVERTPPELVGDLYENGLVMTGGGCLLHGLDTYLSHYLKMPVRRAENPVECVAIGTGRSFEYLDQLVDGFIAFSVRKH